MYEKGQIVTCVVNPYNEDGFFIGHDYIVESMTFIDQEMVCGLKDGNGRTWYTANNIFTPTYIMAVNAKVNRGDRVICLNDEGMEKSLTKGAFYCVTGFSFDYIQVVGNDTSKCSVFRTRFGVRDPQLPEPEPKKNEVTTCDKTPEPEAVDMVNHPPHYTSGGIETIDIMKAKLSEEEFRGFLRGTVIKYLLRAGKKWDEVEDYKKASWYLDKLIKELS